jgi:hypothetical protein
MAPLRSSRLRPVRGPGRHLRRPAGRSQGLAARRQEHREYGGRLRRGHQRINIDYSGCAGERWLEAAPVDGRAGLGPPGARSGRSTRRRPRCTTGADDDGSPRGAHRYPPGDRRGAHDACWTWSMGIGRTCAGPSGGGRGRSRRRAMGAAPCGGAPGRAGAPGGPSGPASAPTTSWAKVSMAGGPGPHRCWIC